LLAVDFLLGDLFATIKLTRLFLRVGEWAVFILQLTPDILDYFLSILLSDFISGLDD
jgi:hypothetical protein